MLKKYYYLGLAHVLNEGTLGGKMKGLQDTAVSEVDGLILPVLVLSIVAAAVAMALQKRKLAMGILGTGVVFAFLAKYAKPIAELIKSGI